MAEDIGGATLAEREAAYRARATAVTRAPFDLATGPLYRVHLFRIDDDRHVVVIVVHHILADLWSMAGIAAREIATSYAAHRAGRASALSALPIQFTDYAHWERERWDAARLDRELAFWKQELAGVETVLELPTDHARPRVQTFRGTRVPIALDAAAAEGMRVVARAEAATTFMALLAAYQIVLSRYTGQTSFCIAAPIANRLTREAEGLIGYFINLLPLRADLSGDPTFREVVRRVRTAAIAAYAHQDARRSIASWPRSRARSHREPQPARASRVRAAERAGRDARARRLARRAARCRARHGEVRPALLQLEERAGGLGGFVEYSADLFERATIDRFLGHFARLVADAGARPDVPISALELLTPRELDHLVVDLNATARPIPDGALPARIAARAARHPERIAVTSECHSLTYGALMTETWRMAHRLRAAGVTRGALVGVAVQRSALLVPALLGVQAAGKPRNVPLDLQYPRDRLAFMIEDSRMRVVIADAASAASIPTGVYVVPLVDPEAHRGLARRRCGAERRPDRRRSRVCAVHVWIDGAPQGRADRPSRGREFSRGDGERAWDRRARRVVRGDEHVVRHRRARAVPAARHGRACTSRPPHRPAMRRNCSRSCARRARRCCRRRR